MNKTFNKFIVALLIACLFVFPLAGGYGGVQAQDSFPPALEPSLSADGLTLYNGVPPLLVVVDPNPTMQGIQVPAEPEVQAAIDAAVADPDATSAAFSITYQADGTTDPWGATCQTFPAEAQTAFNAAAAIWTATIQSPVPITISACWSNSLPAGVLGRSGGAISYRDFTEAPKTNTWYESSLANALHGGDFDASAYDDYITYNSGFSWYYVTDGHPPAGTYDLVTVAAHEIAHGLNFSGTARYAAGTGSYGYDGYPNVYDTFMESGGGTKLTSYTNPSDLGSLLTSDNLWFNGTNANAANGGTRVRMYAPGTWSSGSSYAHLDEIFNGSINDMMTYSVGSGSANHNPGPVTTGLLKDLGWVLAGGTTGSTIYLPLVLRDFASSPPGDFNKSAPANGATGQVANPTLSWGASSNAASYEYCIDTSNNSACDATWTSTAASTSVGLSGLTPAAYYWQVRANNASGTKNADGGTWWSFTIAGSPTGPTAGFWESATGDEFYVTPDQANVDDFAIYLDVTGCGIYKITHLPVEPIVGNQFSFSGSFYASGTFDSTTSAHGTDGLSSLSILDCGIVSGSWSWTATWKNSSQPTIVIEGDAPSVIPVPALQMPYYYHTITVKQQLTSRRLLPPARR